MSPRRKQSRLSTARRLGRLALEAAPTVFAALAFAAGLLMLVSSVTPAFPERLREVTRATPILVLELSHFLASIVGFLLLVVAGGLWRRREGAYYAALALLAGGAVFTLLKGLNYEEALLLVAVAVLLAPCRSAFDRPSRLGGASLSTGSLVAAVAVLAAAWWLGLTAYRDRAYTDELWWTFVREGELPRFLRAGAGLAAVALVFAAIVLLSGPRSRWTGRPARDAVERAASLLMDAPYARPDAWLAALGDKDLLFSASGRSLLPFRARNGLWIAMGEPAGDPDEFADLLWEFSEQADRVGARPVLYAVSREVLPAVASMGMTIRKIGETAVVDLGTFSLTGKAKQDLRTARNRAEREGLAFEVLAPGRAGAEAAALRAVSDAWLDDVGGREKGFSLGRFDAAYLDRNPVAVVRAPDGRPLAFANLMAVRARRELAVDLMRFTPDAPSVLMDFLFVETLLWAQREGWNSLDLGMTPLAGLPDRRLAPAFARVGAFVFEEGEGVYGFQGLRAYKSKFGPEWRPLFMAAGPGASMPLALLEVGVLTSGGWGAVVRDFLRSR